MVVLNQFFDNLHWVWQKLIFCQHKMANWLLSIIAGLVFLKKERDGKLMAFYLTALPFAMPNKVNLLPSVVQIVFSNLKSILSCCLNNDSLMNPCPALVHVGY